MPANLFIIIRHNARRVWCRIMGKRKTMYFSGQIFLNGGFQEGYVAVENGIICRIGRGFCPEKPAAKGIILPTFINAHTHIGDSAVRFEPLPSDSFMEIVAPPDGLKHRALRELTENEIVAGMKRSINDMLASGTSHFCDFRECGVTGVHHLRKSLRCETIGCIVLGRPARHEYKKDELLSILEIADGIGVSSISDWDYGTLQRIAKLAHDRRKMFAIHASERVREDIDKILDLKPAFLVHMNEATENDLILCAAEKIPIVICPRSNLFFGKLPDIPRAVRSGCTVMLGTDNAMLARPDMFLELETAYRTARMRGGLKTGEILEMATTNARKVFNAEGNTGLSEGRKADFLVLAGEMKHPGFEVVVHASSMKIIYMESGITVGI